MAHFWAMKLLHKFKRSIQMRKKETNEGGLHSHLINYSLAKKLSIGLRHPSIQSSEKKHIYEQLRFSLCTKCFAKIENQLS